MIDEQRRLHYANEFECEKNCVVNAVVASICTLINFHTPIAVIGRTGCRIYLLV